MTFLLPVSVPQLSAQAASVYSCASVVLGRTTWEPSRATAVPFSVTALALLVCQLSVEEPLVLMFAALGVNESIVGRSVVTVTLAEQVAVRFAEPVAVNV